MFVPSLVDEDLIRSFRHTSAAMPFHTAVSDLLTQLGIKVELSGSINTSGPTLIIANHESALDNLVLQSLITRPDAKVVGLASHAELGPTMSKHLFPIYRQQNVRDLFAKSLFSGAMQHIVDDKATAMQKNRSSISDAARYVSDNHCVMFFPTGTGGHKPKEGSWKPGIGFLAAQITNPNTQVVFVRIAGGNKIDLLRYGKQPLRTMAFGSAVATVRAHTPISLRKIITDGSTGKEIARQLELAYQAVLGETKLY